MPAGADTLDFDVADPTARTDAQAYQGRFRAADPVHRSSHGFWVVTRHADVLTVLRDARTTTDRRDQFRAKLDPTSPYLTHVEHNLFYRGGDDHARLRGPLARSFTPRAIAALHPRIEATAHALLERVDPAGFDFVRDFATPLPLTVIADLIGVPHSRLDDLYRWSLALVAALEPGSSPAAFAAADAAATEMKALLAELLARRRRDPSDDVLSRVVASGAPLTDDEVLHNAMFLLSAGHGTTTALLTGATRLLTADPAQAADVRDDPAAVADAVEELVRMVSPAQMIGRVAAAPIELGGATIEPGDPILLGLAAANRDPAVFADPDRLDLRRANARAHVGFGFGPHVCLGAPLAREQARVALPLVLARFPRLAADVEPERVPSAILLGYRSWPVHAR